MQQHPAEPSCHRLWSSASWEIPGVKKNAEMQEMEVGDLCSDKGVAQVRGEAMAGAQDKLEATRRALDKRREELRGLERQARPVSSAEMLCAIVCMRSGATSWAV